MYNSMPTILILASPYFHPNQFIDSIHYYNPNYLRNRALFHIRLLYDSFVKNQVLTSILIWCTKSKSKCKCSSRRIITSSSSTLKVKVNPLKNTHMARATTTNYWTRLTLSSNSLTSWAMSSQATTPACLVGILRQVRPVQQVLEEIIMLSNWVCPTITGEQVEEVMEADLLGLSSTCRAPLDLAVKVVCLRP